MSHTDTYTLVRIVNGEMVVHHPQTVDSLDRMVRRARRNGVEAKGFVNGVERDVPALAPVASDAAPVASDAAPVASDATPVAADSDGKKSGRVGNGKSVHLLVGDFAARCGANYRRGLGRNSSVRVTGEKVTCRSCSTH